MSDNALARYGLSAAAPDQRRRIANALLAQQWDRPTPEEGSLVERGSIMPFGTYDNGRAGFAWPSIVHKPVNSIAGVLSGEIRPGTPKFNEAGFDIAGAAMVGGLIAPRPRNALSMSGRPTEPPKGITAYHGSPHDFDRFDMSKIVTGGGVQAYGHGLYFAGNEKVAAEYRRQLGGKTADAHIALANDALIASNESKEAAIARLTNDLKKLASSGRKNALPKIAATQEAIAYIERGGPRPGHMYEVRINALADDFIDWDKPLRQQSEKVRGVVEPYANQVYARRVADRGTADPTDVWHMRDAFSDPVSQVTKQLREAGIPGIRYLDQGSRSAGDGSRNYVVFNDKLIEILRKYGLMGMIGAGGLASELMKPSKIPDDAT